MLSLCLVIGSGRMVIRKLFEDKHPSEHTATNHDTKVSCFSIFLVSLPWIILSLEFSLMLVILKDFHHAPLNKKSFKKVFLHSLCHRRRFSNQTSFLWDNLSVFLSPLFLSILSIWANGAIQMKGFLLSLYRF